MRTPSLLWTRRTRRRGSALAFVLIMTIALAALALSAIALRSNATLQGKSFDREREYRYAAEAALAIGKSRLNSDPMALKQSGDTMLYQNLTLQAADGKTIPGVTVDVYAAMTGSTTGQFGRFASVVALAQDVQHRSRFVRRLELSQESFAKFAYWSDKETGVSGNIIYFNNNDQMRGPVWSNDAINIGTGGATFWDEVGTAKTIAGKSYGVFKNGTPLENQKPIVLPSTANLSYLPGYAASGKLSFNAPNAGGANAVKMRIEFVPVDLDANGTTTGVDEGFIRVYTADPPTPTSYLRGDGTNDNCGDWHGPVGDKHFYPVSVHRMAWFPAHLVATGDEFFPLLINAQRHGNPANTSDDAILSRGGSRCYLGGDPRLVAVERNSAAFPNAAKQKGGDDTTFTAIGTRGRWTAWVGAVDGRLVGRPDAAYLHPLHRSVNGGSKGVIYITGTVGLSGVVRGNFTLYASQNVILLDDLRYATPPQTGLCQDMLGIISGNDIIVADNGLNTPQYFAGYRNMDDTQDFNIHAVMMALNQSFTVENYNGGPSNVNDCEGTNVGRGCLYLNGGVIQKARGPVGLSSGEGFTKRYSYDRCAIGHPPPYFPTTGRLIDNRYYEIDPVGLNVSQFFKTITAGP